MVRMMDSLILHNLPSLGYARITAAKTTTTTAGAETREKGSATKDRFGAGDRRQRINTGQRDDALKRNDNGKN